MPDRRSIRVPGYDYRIRTLPYAAPNGLDRRSIRVPGYDYAQPGTYFVTICAQFRGNRFGRVTDGHMHHNEVGELVSRCWNEIPCHFRDVTLDESVVMPDHVHGILHVHRPITPGGCGLPQPSRFGPPLPGSLATIVRSFKAAAARHSRILLQEAAGLRWQRGFYERIVRNDTQYHAIREYIKNNPARWTRE